MTRSDSCFHGGNPLSPRGMCSGTSTQSQASTRLLALLDGCGPTDDPGGRCYQFRLPLRLAEATAGRVCCDDGLGITMHERTGTQPISRTSAPMRANVCSIIIQTLRRALAPGLRLANVVRMLCRWFVCKLRSSSFILQAFPSAGSLRT
jgi:hypothetical protein